MKTCPSCSRMYSDSVKNCPKCGSSLDVSWLAPEPVQPVSTYAPPAASAPATGYTPPTVSVPPVSTYTPAAAPVAPVRATPADKGNLTKSLKNCGFDVCSSEAEIGKFKLLGCDEGTIDIYERQLELFAKSKVLTKGFGLVGYLAAGKGSLTASVHVGEVRGYKRNYNKKEPLVLFLNDGRVICLPRSDDFEPFLCQCREL